MLLCGSRSRWGTGPVTQQQSAHGGNHVRAEATKRAPAAGRALVDVVQVGEAYEGSTAQSTAGKSKPESARRLASDSSVRSEFGTSWLSTSTAG